jgi:hypothetical protein
VLLGWTEIPPDLFHAVAILLEVCSECVTFSLKTALLADEFGPVVQGGQHIVQWMVA